MSPAPVDQDTPKAAATFTPGETKILAFMGVSGGVGVTSLAIQAALSAKTLLAQPLGRAPRIGLIDLDFEGGAMASYLDSVPGIRSDLLGEGAERIDSALTAALITKHSSGIDLLCAQNGLGGNDRVSPDCVLAILDSAAALFDVIILDVPRLWRPWTHAAIGAADHFALVTELTIPGLHLCRARLSDIENAVEMQSPVEVILNKFERRSMRSRLTIKDAVTTLDRKIAAHICIDTESLTDAMNCGEPVGRLKPDSRYVKDVSDYVSVALGLGAAQTGAVKSKRSWFERRKNRAA